MKKQIVLISSLFFTICVLGQQNIVENDFTNKTEAKNHMVNGMKEGKWMEYVQYDGGWGVITKDTSVATLYRLTIYKDDKPVGTQRQFYKDGHLEAEIFYKDRKQEGLAKQYYESGKVAAETPFENGHINGTVKMYYKNGNLEEEVTFIDNIANGPEKEYYQDGKEKSELTLKDSKVVDRKYFADNNNENK
jgi:antitoxin component YwqK of YwqJK toxin-antitoxin module